MIEFRRLAGFVLAILVYTTTGVIRLARASGTSGARRDLRWLRCGNRSAKRSSETIPTSPLTWSSSTRRAVMEGLSCLLLRLLLLCGRGAWAVTAAISGVFASPPRAELRVATQRAAALHRRTENRGWYGRWRGGSAGGRVVALRRWRCRRNSGHARWLAMLRELGTCRGGCWAVASSLQGWLVSEAGGFGRGTGICQSGDVGGPSCRFATGSGLAGLCVRWEFFPGREREGTRCRGYSVTNHRNIMYSDNPRL